MGQRGRTYKGVIAILLAVMAAGCVYTGQTKITPPIVASFKGESRVDPYLLNHQPQTVAVLPFINQTGKKEALDTVRSP